MKAQGLLFQVQDKGYRDFQSKLIPTIPAETIIGVRTPAIRKLAKEYAKDPESAAFLMQLPHTYYDENILHAFGPPLHLPFWNGNADDAFLG